MPNTDGFQVLPDWYRVHEGEIPLETPDSYTNTNPRYKFFRQRHFTAGDYDQFLAYWDRTSWTPSSPPCLFSSGSSVAWNDSDFPILSPRYQATTPEVVFSTFEYLFHKMKKGIFFKIVNQELRVFLPFSKIHYQNDFKERLVVDPTRYDSFYDLFRVLCQAQSSSFDSSRIHSDRSTWYANNGLLRYEYPPKENDSGINILRDMLMELCRSRTLPDVECFLNKRDFPLLREDLCEPYECMFGEGTPLPPEYRHERWAPILGMTTKEGFIDVPIPTWEDWRRVSYQEEDHKVFPRDYYTYPVIDPGNWEHKLPTAVFRGSSTGLGYTPETNPRLLLSLFSHEHDARDPNDGTRWLDCGITKWNLRPRRHSSSVPFDTIAPSLVKSLPLASFLTPQQQSGYQYILHLPGHSAAYRLGYEMSFGSVLLVWPSPYRIWFFPLLEPFVHFVPIRTPSIDGVLETLRWCKQNRGVCKQIAENALTFYRDRLQKNNILDYLQQMLWKVAGHMGPLRFQEPTYFEKQRQKEQALLQEYHDMYIHKYLQKDPFLKEWLRGWDFQKDIYQRVWQQSSLPVLCALFTALSVLRSSSFLLAMETEGNVRDVHHSQIRKVTVYGRTFCKKNTTSPELVEEYIHEGFTGFLAMNEMAFRYPHFLPYIRVDGTEIWTIWQEHLPMQEWLHVHFPSHPSSSFFGTGTMTSFPPLDADGQLSTVFDLFQQLCVVLLAAQEEKGFIHFDLYPWNVMVAEHPTPQTYEFAVGMDTIVRMTSTYHPVLIDYGKSHTIYRQHRFHHIYPFHSSGMHDMISIIISTIHHLLSHVRFGKKASTRILSLMNWFSGSPYTNYQRFSTIHDVKAFVRYKKKFSQMVLDEKEIGPKKTLWTLFEWFRLDALKHSCETATARKPTSHVPSTSTYVVLSVSRDQEKIRLPSPSSVETMMMELQCFLKITLKDQYHPPLSRMMHSSISWRGLKEALLRKMILGHYFPGQVVTIAPRLLSPFLEFWEASKTNGWKERCTYLQNNPPPRLPVYFSFGTSMASHCLASFTSEEIEFIDVFYIPIWMVYLLSFITEEQASGGDTTSPPVLLSTHHECFPFRCLVFTETTSSCFLSS